MQRFRRFSRDSIYTGPARLSVIFEGDFSMRQRLHLFRAAFAALVVTAMAGSVTAQAPGFASESGRLAVQTIGAPNPPLTFTLKKGGAGAPASALGSMTAKDLQAELAKADQMFNAQQWDDAIAAYKGILAKAPALSVINLQIAAAYRNKKDYDNAIASYNELLKADPNNDKAKIGIGMTKLEKGDLQAAENTLQQAADTPNPTREVFYNLGEVKFA